MKLFIHIPKTGGTSVSEVLKIQAEHTKAKEYSNEELEDSWSIIRNPYNRAVSIFTEVTGVTPTTELLKKFWLGKIKYSKAPIESMTEYLTKEGKISVPLLLTFENLNEEFQEKFGKTLPHLNKGGCLADYSHLYDDELREIIVKRFKIDFITFNYQE